MPQRVSVPKNGRVCPQPHVCKVTYHRRGTKCVKTNTPKPQSTNHTTVKKVPDTPKLSIGDALTITQVKSGKIPPEGYVSHGKNFVDMFHGATPDEKKILAEEMGETVEGVEYLASYADECLSGKKDPYADCDHYGSEDECYCQDFTENLDDYELPYTLGGLRTYQSGNQEKFQRYFSAGKHKVKGETARKYYQQLLDKHFDRGTATGSYFTDSQLFQPHLKGTPLDKLLFIASRQLGGLLRDDREKYTDVTSDAFNDNMYYVKIEGIQGQQRAVSKEEALKMFNSNRKVYLVATKDGVPPDYVIRTERTSPTYHATLVMADEKDPTTGELTGRRVVITAFPGSPTPPQKAHSQHKTGDTISLKDVPPGATVLFK